MNSAVSGIRSPLSASDSHSGATPARIAENQARMGRGVTDRSTTDRTSARGPAAKAAAADAPPERPAPHARSTHARSGQGGGYPHREPPKHSQLPGHSWRCSAGEDRALVLRLLLGRVVRRLDPLRGLQLPADAADDHEQDHGDHPDPDPEDPKLG